MRSLLLTLLIVLWSHYQNNLALSVSEKFEKNVIHLDMAPNSAAYIFTQSPEADEIAINYMEEERKKNQTFNDVWQFADREMKCKIPSELRREHMLAVYAYTVETPRFYSMFNEAVRRYGVNDAIYAERFNFKSFHYLLSTALQKLRVDSGSKSYPTFRGFNMQTDTNVGAEIRFGYYASSSLDEEVALIFINMTEKTNTMLEITTQYGVPIQECSNQPDEKEILIPPYEKFQVRKIVSREYGTKIQLTEDGLKGTNVKVEKDKDGKMVVLRSGDARISALGGLWILAALVSISV
ncbi:erythroblast NAD(P)(+)--arginine ADP-ribosyltransferase-like [Heptranchias perlo]|uniref:erythroblast NAD(P)(+)--arginine ADP-ribosyltransferase-like n=1 Tax=Heptranchias perlo TaxID=212740 RepID=UPI003559D6C6